MTIRVKSYGIRNGCPSTTPGPIPRLNTASSQRARNPFGPFRSLRKTMHHTGARVALVKALPHIGGSRTPGGGGSYAEPKKNGHRRPGFGRSAPIRGPRLAAERRQPRPADAPPGHHRPYIARTPRHSAAVPVVYRTTEADCPDGDANPQGTACSWEWLDTSGRLHPAPGRLAMSASCRFRPGHFLSAGESGAELPQSPTGRRDVVSRRRGRTVRRRSATRPCLPPPHEAFTGTP